MNRSCSNKISCVFFSSRAAQNDNGRAQLFTECLQGKRIQRTRAPLLREKQKKKKNGNNLHFDSISGGLTKC